MKIFNKEKKISFFALVTGLVGVVLIWAPFSTIGFFQYFSYLLIGLILYLSSITLGIVAIFKKEKGNLKFSPFLLALPLVLLIAIMSQYVRFF